MNSNLKEYYKLRGLYNHSQHVNMDAQSKIDSNAVQRLQKDMDTALDDISVYLHQQVSFNDIATVFESQLH